MKLMEVNFIIKDKKIPILRIHVLKKASEFTKTWNNSLTKKNNMLKIHKKQRR